MLVGSRVAALGSTERLTALWRVARWGLFTGGLVYCVLAMAGAVYDTSGGIVMRDAASYYYANTPYDWLDDPPGAGEFRYSPAFLWVIGPLRLLPWEAFAAVWFAAHIAVLLYLRVPWMLAFPGVIDDVVRGNVVTFLALAAVLIVHRSAAPLWATFLLTKVVPGVAVVWHGARREWRAFLVAIGVTTAVVGVGWLTNPQLWSAWFSSLLAGPETYPQFALTVPIWLRILGGGLISGYAGLSNRPWILPIGMLVAMPGWWPYTFAILIASVALFRPAAHRAVVTPTAAPST